MNKQDLIRCVTANLKRNEIRKPVSSPSHVFHISDDDGNKKDFVVKSTDKTVMYTFEDVEAIFDTALKAIVDALKTGEPVVLRGFGKFSLKYMKPKSVKLPATETWVDIDGHFAPSFYIGNDLKRSAKMYEESLRDKNVTLPDIVFKDTNNTGGD